MVQEGRAVTGAGHPERRALKRRLVVVLLAAVVAAALGGIAFEVYERIRFGPVPTFREQACGLPTAWLERTRRGYFEPRSGQISLLPRTPAYMASGGEGWSHSGPWPYLQDVPLVFYGPGLIPAYAGATEPATMADIAPTIGSLLGIDWHFGDGKALAEVAPRPSARPPKLVLTIVWDGGGWNTLRMYDGDWPNLERLIAGGVSFTDATVGSSPSVTPAVHSTLGTGSYPWTAGVTGVAVRDEAGEVADAFLEGESGRFLQRTTLAESWDERRGGRPLIGMLGYEPWHLGMIGKGAEFRGEPDDDAVWLDVETNEWITNPDHYRLPKAVTSVDTLDGHLEELDARDGAVDGAWLDNDILGMPDRIEETPAFIRFHTDVLLNLVREGGYGDDDVTDLLFTNFKQIDRVGHYFNMDSPEVRESLVETDRQLGRIIAGLDEDVGPGNYVIVLTADHGQQPDAAAVDGFGIDPNEVERDIATEFGPVIDAVWPTEVFLDDEGLAREGVTVDEVARWLGDYRIEDNAAEVDGLGAALSPSDRAFEMAIPSRMLPGIECGG